MLKLRTISRYFIITLLAAILLSSCDGDLACHDGVYGDKLVVKSKKVRKDNSYWYVVGDDGTLDRGFDLYTNKIFNVGDTIEFKTLHSH
jgi:hypothetical protein